MRKRELPSLVFNDINSKYFNIFLLNKPSIPFAEKSIKDICIVGRNGSLTIDKNTYKDIEISVELVQVQWLNKYFHISKIRDWLINIKDNKLCLPYLMENNTNSFFRVKYVKMGEFKKVNDINDKLLKFNAIFVCEPFLYNGGGIIIDTKNTKKYIYDSYTIIPSSPIYRIQGEGLIKIAVNGKEVSINVGQNCIIDTKRRKCYKYDGMPVNSSMKGDYEDLYILNGDNEITWSGNITNLTIEEDIIIC